MELLEDEKVWFFKYSDKDISFIQRRTALRRAREISKVGFINSATGTRIGVGFECKEEDVEDLKFLHRLKQKKRNH